MKDILRYPPAFIREAKSALPFSVFAVGLMGIAFFANPDHLVAIMRQKYPETGGALYQLVKKSRQAQKAKDLIWGMDVDTTSDIGEQRSMERLAEKIQLAFQKRQEERRGSTALQSYLLLDALEIVSEK